MGRDRRTLLLGFGGNEMNLYEIDKAILDCLDLETGEVLDPEALEALQMERDAKIENVALWVKNLTAEAAALKAEKDAFEKRQKAAERKAESLKRWLSSALGGQKFSTDRCAVTFRKSDAVIIDDMDMLTCWLVKTGNEDWISYGDPRVNKTELKKVLKNGLELDSAHLEERQNITIK